jgi:hypothetical protein
MTGMTTMITETIVATGMVMTTGTTMGGIITRTLAI